MLSGGCWVVRGGWWVVRGTCGVGAGMLVVGERGSLGSLGRLPNKDAFLQGCAQIVTN